MIQCVECGRDLIAPEDRDNWLCEDCQIKLRNEKLEQLNNKKTSTMISKITCGIDLPYFPITGDEIELLNLHPSIPNF